jgi:hypothetical protein
MTRDEFLDRVTTLKIDPKSYDLNGRRPESYVLEEGKGTYNVFYSERGLQSNKEESGDESAAFERLLELLAREPSNRMS